MEEKHILYITYDGLTDPLGQSQILPYVKGLEKNGYRFTILSFEKTAPFQKNKGLIETQISGCQIEWVPLAFSTRPPLLAKFYDALRMKSKAVSLHRKSCFDMVHCRSYIAADVGLYLKKSFGVRFFFDMRGFWADEKKDGGSWNPANPIFREVYRYYKAKEGQYLRYADYIISLTEAGKSELTGWPSYNGQVPVSVIPCCADMELFSLTDKEQKISARAHLGFKEGDLVISYLGSVGTWYMLDEMLHFFRKLKAKYPGARFLFVTHSDPAIIRNRAKDMGISEQDVVIKEAARKEVPTFIKASDINISFIKPVYSKISSSPTKLGEVLAMGIPVICNGGVGDVKKIVEYADAGFVMDNFEEESFDLAVLAVPDLLKKVPIQIREKAKEIYNLEAGIKKYLQSYHQVFHESKEESSDHLSLS